ncbi:N-acetyltransferase [Burkholderia sp. WAC0059]|uniref:GNAT family N-acetyltransferase n=1 Tax=Burkholderia sp. WAC0059 TaxID=2066022 RepID=UPI000C7F4614|nr:GNAT family protein [Burkholderia sp. WAC0059]PLZ01806.1 N-acetyltransferase [Burkholderia sp. WAC0059]
MSRVAFDRGEAVMQFVARLTGEPGYDGYTAIGLERDDRIVAGVVYQGHNGPNVMMHFALAGSGHLMVPAFVGAAFVYPFQVLGCHRVTGLVRADNEAAHRLIGHLGFVREGVLREGASDRTDFVVYGMLRGECRFLQGRYLAALQGELARTGQGARIGG